MNSTSDLAGTLGSEALEVLCLQPLEDAIFGYASDIDVSKRYLVCFYFEYNKDPTKVLSFKT